MAAGLLACCVVPVAAFAEHPVTPRSEGLALPGPSNTLDASGSARDFRSTLDEVLGPGGWRETSGYRSRAREDELRREGAGTVPRGVLSHHSMGTPDAPGAYDIVVRGMSQRQAAGLLRSSGAGFSRVVSEGAHGREGAHLHIEMASASAPLREPGPTDDARLAERANACDSIYLRVVGGRRNPRLSGC
jgi:hypothetical protein